MMFETLVKPVRQRIDTRLIDKMRVMHPRRLAPPAVHAWSFPGRPNFPIDSSCSTAPRKSDAVSCGAREGALA